MYLVPYALLSCVIFFIASHPYIGFYAKNYFLRQLEKLVQTSLTHYNIAIRLQAKDSGDQILSNCVFASFRLSFLSIKKDCWNSTCENASNSKMPSLLKTLLEVSLWFFRQKCLNGLPSPPPGDLPDPGIKPALLLSPTWVGGFFTTSAIWEAQNTGETKYRQKTDILSLSVYLS